MTLTIRGTRLPASFARKIWIAFVPIRATRYRTSRSTNVELKDCTRMEAQESISAAELERKLGPLDREAYTRASCERFADTIAQVQRLKRERRAVILAHNYQRP